MIIQDLLCFRVVRANNKKKNTRLAVRLTLLHAVFSANSVFADTDIDQCILEQVRKSIESTTIETIKRRCEDQSINDLSYKSYFDESSIKLGAISNRVKNERESQFSPYVITPHKLNYFIPVLTTNAINRSEYGAVNGFEDNLEDIEAKFQLSLKVPLSPNSTFIYGDGLYLAFTLEAWWQVYSDGISKPFRETNYQPELFYVAPLDWHPLGGNTGFSIGIEHQSNGREQNLSRSWNRVYGHFLFEKEQFAMSIKPWLRISEDEKKYPEDPNGDDNPDIIDYMGHFELTTIYKWSELEINFKGRNNFATHKGAAEFIFVFPLWGKLQGYSSLFTGYGESLIDYNYKQTRFGIGLSLNSLL